MGVFTELLRPLAGMYYLRRPNLQALALVLASYVGNCGSMRKDSNSISYTAKFHDPGTAARGERSVR